ncbi:hypothetical protein RJ639_017026 [Escallonia herrerae]|uniref:GDSL esterase/lipase n=1 Tax=Escallonia herrerae TaxID=1293975 RepID=A0AA88VB90_9ASTE|nr:hypothetical protein RJ639_017026 [Escallonia herrerae]
METHSNVHAQGGRSFWIHNTGPVGCLPYVMDWFPITAAQIDKFGCAGPPNEVAQYFNVRLKEAVIELRNDLPLATITYVDIYSVKYSLSAKQRNSVIPCLLLIECCSLSQHNALLTGLSRHIFRLPHSFSQNYSELLNLQR